MKVKRDTPCTSKLLVVERDTPCTSKLLKMERDTPCKSKVHGGGKRYTLHVNTRLLLVLYLIYSTYAVEKS
jgi:hypothetical protein